MSKTTRIIIIVVVVSVLWPVSSMIIQFPLSLFVEFMFEPETTAYFVSGMVIALLALVGSVGATWWTCRHIWRGTAPDDANFERKSRSRSQNNGE